MVPPRRMTASSQVSRKASRPAKDISILHSSSPGGGLAAAAFGSSERRGLSEDRVKGDSEIMRPLRDGSRGACATRPPRTNRLWVQNAEGQGRGRGWPPGIERFHVDRKSVVEGKR